METATTFPPTAALSMLTNGTPQKSFVQVGSRPLTTDELAITLGLAPDSIRKRLSITGSYFGIRPAKLPNRRLLWPANSLATLTQK